MLVLSENPEQFLRDGYGIKTNAETPVPSEFCNFSRNRTFSILLSKEVLTTSMQTSQMDTAQKEMLEDAYSLQKDFMNPDQLGLEQYIEQIQMLGTSEIAPFIGENENFIFLEVIFQVQITDII